MSKSDTERPKGTRETLDYIQAMLRELKVMADSERREMLSYLIEMAYVEVGDSIRNLASKPMRKTAF